jgi:ABC-2 type transport system permease protein
MSKIARFLIRVSAFLGKEIHLILRQPMLVLTLVLGPFLILLLFGLGFRNDPQALRTLFVVPQTESGFAQQLQEYVTTLGPQLIFMGVTDDQAQAIARLRKREVDVVAVIPGNAYELIRHSQPVTIELNHYEIDPFQVEYINIFGRVYADEINRRVLRTITREGQQNTIPMHASLNATRKTITDMRQALAVNDQVQVAQYEQKLERDVSTMSLAVGVTLGLADSVQQAMGDNSPDTKAISDLLANIREDTHSRNEPNSPNPDRLAAEERLDKIEADFSKLEALLGEFQNIDADVLVRPFRSEAKSVATVEIRPSDFFAPAVIALLLQHLAVTFAALSIVREQRDGTLELFRVSPVSAFETLLGKYLSYLFFAGVLAAILTLFVVYGLRVPLLGNWLLLQNIMLRGFLANSLLISGLTAIGVSLFLVAWLLLGRMMARS